MSTRWLVLTLLGLVVAGCSDDTEITETERAREVLAEPGPLVAGVAEVLMPVPLGVGTMGNGAIGKDPVPTPFNQNVPGTQRVHGPLTLRAVALSRGEGHEVVLVRIDAIGMFQHMREAVLDELESRLGRDLDDALIIAANHTHSGPGRLLQVDSFLSVLGDTFFPELYENLTQALADVVEQALDDQRPAELGHVLTSSSDAHNDRRCENDPLDQVQEVPDLPVVAVHRDGQLDALIASYAYHGTIIGFDALTLSGDMGAVAERKIAERFDHPVLVLLFNSWGGDMSPGSVDLSGATGADQPSDYDRLDGLGERLADAIVPALDGMALSSEPEVGARTYRMHLSREAIGYDDETFPFPNGGVYCGGAGDGNCETASPLHGLDRGCLAFSSLEPAPKQTMVSAGRIGDLFLLAGPGEWTTHLADTVLDAARALSGGDVMFVGYANDYAGYLLTEADWWQGGYEAGGGLWGPGQGDYVAARAGEAFATFFEGYVEPPFAEPEPIAKFSGYSYDPYVPETPVGAGTIEVDVPSEPVAATGIVSFTVLGTDPWLGPPVATLEQDGGGGFQPVLLSTGRPVQSDGYLMWIDLTVQPSYVETLRAEARTFRWQLHFPLSRRVPAAMPPLDGELRFSVRVPMADGQDVVVTTGTFRLADAT